MSPNSERFQPPKLWNAIGTGIGTLTPTMPIWTRLANSRAASPSRVKIATPLPYSWSLTSLTALVEIGRAHDRQHRAEDLLLVDAHLGLDVVEQAAAEEEAVLVALQFEAAAVDDELGAFLDAEIDIGAHLLEMLRR